MALSPPTEIIPTEGILNVETWFNHATVRRRANVDTGIPLVNTISVVSEELPWSYNHYNHTSE
jgi:hypothetical protein